MKLHNRDGFTLIELIGVLAVISILAALIAPKIFEVISDSKATRMAADTNAYKAAIARWYKDIGTLQSLDASGVAAGTDTSFEGELLANLGTTSTTGLWSKWNGPYIDSVANLSVGTALTIETNAGATGTAAPVATNSTSWDLDDDNKNEMAGRQVVAIKVTVISSTEFGKIDAIIDSGLTAANYATSGRAKYDSSGSIMYVYLASN